MLKHYSFLRWAGGKTRLLPFLTLYALQVPYTRYLEPFLGGGSFFFYLASQNLLQGKHVILSDLNEDLINCYTQVRDRVEDLIYTLKDYPTDLNAEFYYHVRSYKPTDLLERAARFIYLNHTCFNGLYRVNSRNEFNVPYGKRLFTYATHVDMLRWASSLLANAELRTCSFQEISTHQDDFIYLDPPYDPLSTTSSFTSYTAENFNSLSQHMLLNYVKQAHFAGAKFLLSNSNTNFVRDLYRQFYIQEVKCTRSIASKTASRKPVKELLISNICVTSNLC